MPSVPTLPRTVHSLWTTAFNHWWDDRLSFSNKAVLIEHWNTLKASFDPASVFPETRPLTKRLIKDKMLEVFYWRLPEADRHSLGLPITDELMASLQRRMAIALTRVKTAIKKFDAKAANSYLKEEKKQARQLAQKLRTKKTLRRRSSVYPTLGDDSSALL